MIVRADDSSGIIGDACRRLLDLHPKAAAAAGTPASKLIDRMMKFQFDDDEVDYFELDPVAYAPALGEVGMSAYRRRLAEVEARLGHRPSEDDRWTSCHSHEWFTLDWNAQRLAVLDHDIEAIIRTHAKDRKVAAWLEDTAEAFEEIGEIDLAIDWAKQAVDFDCGHQSLKAAAYWCGLLEEHRSTEALQARLSVFRKWPSSTSAARLHKAAGKSWPDFRDEVVAKLAASPSDAVLFALLTLKEPSSPGTSPTHCLSTVTTRGASWRRGTKGSTRWQSSRPINGSSRTSSWRLAPSTTGSPPRGWRRCGNLRPGATGPPTSTR